jgi:hypothetical protein
MNYEIPTYLERSLQELGVLSTQHEELDDPTQPEDLQYVFRMPELDENGDPPF